MAGMSPAREIAYDTFIAVIEGKRSPDVVIDELITASEKPIKRVDRNLIKEIVFGSLRWYSKIYWILQHTSNRDLDKSTPEIRAALILGTYQIFYMDRVPDRAAVNESVEYIRRKSQANACTFVNGILRQIARRAQYFAKPDKETKPVAYLSLQFAHPEWMVERWLKRFKFARLETMLAANNVPAPFAIRINSELSALDKSQELIQSFLKEERNHVDRRPLRSCLHVKSSPSIEDGSLFQRGYYTIQGEASQLIGYLVAPEQGDHIVDACSGKGGKTTHLVELLKRSGKVTAVEKDPSQIQMAKVAAQRLGHTDHIEFVEADFAEWKHEGKVQKVLLDSPCSGLGVLRRHPEGKWLKQPDIVAKMANIQKDLLSHAWSLLSPGGELIYSVCSFETEETTDQLKWLMNKYGDKIEIVSPVQRLPDYYKRYVTRENILHIYFGNQDQMDGFGAFIVKKKS